MDNPFKKILQDEKLPVYIKDRVIDNLNFIKLSLDVSELYTVKVPQALGSVIGESDKKKEQELIEKIINAKKNENNDE
ncbi:MULTISPECIES: hypothetical protein [Myroides]|uniref:Uncharacterized protein n=1 Tax=Myroides albus TaxID=2562892 RepID=A0A6I3LBA2_9FLAO|nr:MULTISPECIES: hypothetical protein [Myroides]MTG96729.1 hypothetical protein [Myroides albus]MVX35629.1 hypothetical protein [Myroides sp. LoEW2-1]UVD80859.1 hypothetical protein NWE55_06350 [Myroides albus]